MHCGSVFFCPTRHEQAKTPKEFAYFVYLQDGTSRFMRMEGGEACSFRRLGKGKREVWAF
jgi:hypothetical protein